MKQASLPLVPASARRRRMLLAAGAWAASHVHAAPGGRLQADKLRELDARLAAHQPLRALLIERGDEQHAYYRAGTTAASLVHVASVTKSVVALLVGAAIERGHLTSVDEPLAAFFPEHATGARAATLSRVTLAHLLALSSGFDRMGLNSLTDYPDFLQRLNAPGLLAHALSRPLVAEPGRHFYYSNLDAHLVGLALARRLPMPLADFARDALFAPLGIESFSWHTVSEGATNAASELRMRPPDMLRIGRLVRQEGLWQGRRLVSQAFLRDATRRHVATDVPVRGRPDLWGYGYLWWLASTPGDDLPAWYAAGYGGQFIYVVPDLQLVIAAVTEQVSREVAGRTASLIRDAVLPAVR